MNVTGLAAALGMHPSTTPRLLAPLKRNGLLRTHAGTDRRERVIAITRKGEASLVRAFPRWAEVQSHIVGQLGTQEWLCAMMVLRKIRSSLRE